jgi:ABC-type phosphate/phosphonate transport system substrate-binding protein
VAATTSDFHHEASLLGGSRAEIGLLEQTGRPPNDAICAAPGTDAEIVQQFTEALLRLNPEKDLGQARVGQVEKLSGFSPTDDSLYDSLRESWEMESP